jgi:aerobic-type carbon monoxide dehydrogenase small subunit (CoxS/CutS family)
MLTIEVQGNQVQFDVEKLIERIDGIENCSQLLLMEIGNYLFETNQCAIMMDIQKIEKDAILAVAYEIIDQLMSRKI